ncbi:MAG TPA: TetR/AcrR family transcriptional regulator [Candidatus Binataceae bacterium]|nr:TetR/AcrR family transcriptional regulator [Candidatus Binataceae bacterium]
MPNIVRKIVRTARSRNKSGLRDGRTWALYEAALRRLASKDYEQISIAEIARGAGCSIGAFYGRFGDKNAFLHMVISSAFRTLRTAADRDLAPKQWRGVAREKVVEGVVRHVVTNMSSPKQAGVTRAALKLATIKPSALEPLQEYRANVSDHAVALLAPRLSFSDAQGSIRVAVQLIFGTVIDSTLQHAGPLRVGSRRMINTMTALTVSYLKLPRKGLFAESGDHDGDETAEECESAGAGAEEQSADEQGAGQTDTWDPDQRKVIGTARLITSSRRRSRRSRDSDAPPKPLPIENPKHVKPPEPPRVNEGGTGAARSGKPRLRRI